jgi:ATP-dependent helicase/nuclease subunit A
MFRRAVEEEDQPLALAASAEQPAAESRPPILHRLPLTFNPHSRFEAAAANRLPYTPASDLRQGPAFDRPEGSFAVRAFGNVVHRYLQLLATHLEAASPVGEPSGPNQKPWTLDPEPWTLLLAELPNWLPRLTASLRSEGLAPTALDRLAQRSLHALQQTLTDPTGRWILSPHIQAHTEQPLRLAAQDSEMRVDRTFLAGPDPLSEGDSHLWIVDFKTTEQGSRSPELFAQQEQAKYCAQLQSYATAQLALPNPPKGVIQALYYPSIPRLIFWTGIK